MTISYLSFGARTTNNMNSKANTRYSPSQPSTLFTATKADHVDISPRFSGEANPLHKAVTGRNTAELYELFQLTKKQKQDPKKKKEAEEEIAAMLKGQDNKGNTPLHLAAAMQKHNKNDETAKMLVYLLKEAGSPDNIENEAGETAAEIMDPPKVTPMGPPPPPDQTRNTRKKDSGSRLVSGVFVRF